MTERYKRVRELLDVEGPRLHALLARLTRREDVTGDLLQELVVRLCQSGGLERARDPFAYAYRSAVNLAFEWRRARRVARCSELKSGGATRPDPSPLGAVIREEELERVLGATARLREPGRSVVILRYVEQMSYEEIARRLGKKPQHVRSTASKAVAQLRVLLADGEIDGG